MSRYKQDWNVQGTYSDMKSFSGARNVAGFTNTLKAGMLPPHTHLTYEGLFNELKYNVGPKTDKIVDLHFGYSRFQFADSQFDNSINDYLALFMKGKGDGEEREDDIRLNLVVCLDVSGSMSCGLGSMGQEHLGQNRLALSIEAIKMLISKLKPNDSMGMVVFNNSATTVFECTPKRNISSEIFERLDSIRAGGGTTIINGFKHSTELLLKWMETHSKEGKCENRVIMLTDVCDPSIGQYKQFLEMNANANNIHTSIIGISTEFQSQSCEVFKDIKGFNYFCAVNQEDIKKYIFETFDFGFFPSATNIQVDIEAEDIGGIQVFGTPDADKVEEYKANSNSNVWTVTKVKSCFPSEVEMDGDSMYTVGGLILVKLKRNTKGPSFSGKVGLKYEDPDGKVHSQTYSIKFEFHPEEQFFSGDELREAIEGFTFASELKKILKESSGLSDRKMIYQKYWQMLANLESLCPKQKLKEFENIKKIVGSYGKEGEELESAK